MPLHCDPCSGGRNGLFGEGRFCFPSAVAGGGVILIVIGRETLLGGDYLKTKTANENIPDTSTYV